MGGAPLLTSVDLHSISPLQCHVPLQRVTMLVLSAHEPYTEQFTDLNMSELVSIFREVGLTLQHLELDGNLVLPQSEHAMKWPDVELRLRMGDQVVIQ